MTTGFKSRFVCWLACFQVRSGQGSAALGLPNTWIGDILFVEPSWELLFAGQAGVELNKCSGLFFFAGQAGVGLDKCSGLLFAGQARAAEQGEGLLW